MEKSGMKIGFVGVGRMGANMARRLHDQGFTVSAVFDAHRPTADALAHELGTAAPATLAEVTAASDVVITVVTDDAAMEAIFATSGDSLLVNARGKTFVNCATVAPRTHVMAEERAAAAGAVAVECCLASSIPQARNGTLFLITGGDAVTIDRLTPLFEALGSANVYAGGNGRGAQVKALVNMLMNINTAGLAEALALADALGLNLDLVQSVFARTGANSRVLETDGPDMQNRDHEVFFSAAHAAKDSGIALDLARESGIAAPLAAATKAQYDTMVAKGLGELDKSGIAELTFKGRGA